MMNNFLFERIRADRDRIQQEKKEKIYAKGMAFIDPFLCHEWEECVAENSVKNLKVAYKVMVQLNKTPDLDKAVAALNRGLLLGADKDAVCDIVINFSDLGFYFENRVYG